MANKNYSSSDAYHSILSYHPEDVSPKDLVFYCYLKGRETKRRFFASLRMTSKDPFLIA
jgi:hypothetical protein